MSEAELAQLVAKLYDPTDGDFDQILAAPWTIGLKRLASDTLAIVVRGSVTEQDFIDDLRSEFGTAVRGFEPLGPLPFGFARELTSVVQLLQADWRGASRVIFAGHSLGACRACDLAGAYVLLEKKECRVQGLGCPRPGTRQLASLLSQSDVRLYVNGHDPVYSLPVPLVFTRWSHPGTTTHLREEPASKARSDSIGGQLWHSIPFISWHQVSLYVEGIEAMA